MKILYSHRIRSRDGQGVHLDAMVLALRAEGQEVLVVGPPGFDTAGLGDDSPGLARFRRLMPRWVAELAELAYAVPSTWRLLRAAAKFRPDVIYERGNLYHLAGQVAARVRRVPLLLEVNAPLAEERARFGGLGLPGLAGWLERVSWRGASMALPVTAVLGDRLLAAGVPAARIRVIHNGIDLADFPPAAATRSRPGPLTLGFIGFVRDWHGLDGVLRGIAAWHGTTPLRLLLVGEGPALAGLQRLAAELGIAHRVEFHGLARREEVPGLMARFDIALQPSAVPYASPLKLFEYMAAGRAIVAPDQPNLREILRHEENALLFDSSRPTAFWEAVERLAADAALRARLGAGARCDIIQQRLTWRGNAQRVIGIAQAEMARMRPARAPILAGTP